MKTRRLILKNLWFFRLQFSLIFAGLTLCAAVISSSLITGDSVKYSLSEIAEKRTGNAAYVITSHFNYLNSRTSKIIKEELKINCSSVLHLKGNVIAAEYENAAPSVNIYGIDKDFFKLSPVKKSLPEKNTVYINNKLSKKLQAKAGDELIVNIAKQDATAGDSPFASLPGEIATVKLIIAEVIDDSNLANFNLKIDQVQPLNIFIQLTELSSMIGRDNAANILLVSDGNDIIEHLLAEKIKETLAAEDIGIKIRHCKTNTLEVISENIFIAENIEKPIIEKFTEAKPILTYFIEEYSTKNHTSFYSFCSSVGEDIIPNLSESEIIINRWLAEELKATRGDSVTLKYIVPGPLRQFASKERKLKITGIAENTSDIADSTLMPEIKGISNKSECNSWETGLPLDLKKITGSNEEYWKKYKGTPTAFISKKLATELWSNKYGSSTSIRINSYNINENDIIKAVTRNNKIEKFGVFVKNQKHENISSSAGSVDFGELFLSLNFFLIATAIIIAIMLVSFLVDLRIKEIVTFQMLGFSEKKIFVIFYFELIFIISIGAIAGTIAGIYLNEIILAAIRTIWKDIAGTDNLQSHAPLKTLFTGGSAAFIIMILTLYFSLKMKLQKTITALRKIVFKKTSTKANNWIYFIMLPVLLIAPVALYFIAKQTSKITYTSYFIISAILILTFFILSISWFLQSQYKRSKSVMTMWHFIKKNAAYNFKFTIGKLILISTGTFLISAISFNNTRSDFNSNNKKSGTGAFDIYSELGSPLEYNPNTNDGKKYYNIPKSMNNLQFSTIYAIEGNDASCLNINKVSRPGLLGVDNVKFSNENLFTFSDSVTNISSMNVWSELGQIKTSNNKTIINGVADMNVIKWSLNKKIGDTLSYISETGDTILVRLIAGLQNSIFQGKILICDSILQLYYKHSSSPKIILTQAGSKNINETIKTLDQCFFNNGIQSTTTSERLEKYASVEKTYLEIFSAIAGISMILSIAGIIIILIKNIGSNRNYFALLNLLGITLNKIRLYILTENIIICTIGLILGATMGILSSVPAIETISFNNISQTILFILGFYLAITGLITVIIITTVQAKYLKNRLRNL